MFNRPLGIRAVWTRFGVRSPQPHWGSSIHFWLDHRRKVRAIAEELNVASNMEVTTGEQKTSPHPILTELFTSTADCSSSAQQREHQPFPGSISHVPSLSLSIPTQPPTNPRPSTNPGLCLGSALSLGSPPLFFF